MTRRDLVATSPLGVASMALADLLEPRKPHFAAQAKSIIYLFMEGGPSHLDLYQHKPKLTELDGQPTPSSLMAGKKFAFMERMAAPTLYGSRSKLKQYGQSGHWISSRLPKLAACADDLAFVHSMRTTNVNHSPAAIAGRMAALRVGCGGEGLAGVRLDDQRSAGAAQRE